MVGIGSVCGGRRAEDTLDGEGEEEAEESNVDVREEDDEGNEGRGETPAPVPSQKSRHPSDNTPNLATF